MRLTNLLIPCLFATTLLTAQIDPPGRVGRLNFREGPVSFQPAGEEDWIDAPLNRPLVTGDSIWSGANARAELHAGSIAIRIGANTAMQLLNLNDQTLQIRLSEGTLSLRIRDVASDQAFEVDTPNIAFTIDESGEYRIDANPDSQTTTVTIRAGEGDITGGGQSFPLSSRQQAVITGDSQIAYRLASPPVMDAWDQWCAARDHREDQSVSARYVSREVPGYEDLDQYGEWSTQTGYGDVWMPNNLQSGWAPYRDGRWTWIAPWGWTWVDDAPWGFAPYHYGRWAFFGSRWGWIPGPRGLSPVYSPALVGWVGGGGFSASVAWFPLGPREPYFPSYRVSQNYFRRVNTTNTVFNNSTVTINNYYNSRAVNTVRYVNRNGTTAVPRETFSTGGRIFGKDHGPTHPQWQTSPVIAAPAVAPRRESVFGAPGRAAAPPPRTVNRPVVARTPPPAAAVPFGRQQDALTRNPGRPLPAETVQKMRRETPVPAPQVRVMDTERIRRQPQSSPNQAQPPAADRPQRQDRGRPERPRNNEKGDKKPDR